MSVFRSRGSSAPKRALRPMLDGRLEDRIVLSGAKLTPHEYMAISQRLLNNPSPKLARVVGFPAFTKDAPGVKETPRPFPRAVAVQTLRGGQAVQVAAPDGSHYRIQLSYISNTPQTAAIEGAAGLYAQGSGGTALGIAQPTELPQPLGTVRVYPMPGGAVGIVVDGSTDNTELTINPLPQPIKKGYAHSFAYGQSQRDHVLKIGQITVNSGSIGSILGFHTADLAGPVDIAGTGTVDRIAFRSLLPGASITTGGDLDTLDILQGIHLSGSNSNIQIGRDLNLLNAGQDIVLENGASLVVGRDLGLTVQPPKGTGTGSNVLTLNTPLVGDTYVGPALESVSAYIQGDLVIDPSSRFVVSREVDNKVYIGGDLVGGSRLFVPIGSPFEIRGTASA